MSLNRIGLLLPVVLLSFCVSLSTGCGGGSKETSVPESGSIDQYLKDNPDFKEDGDTEMDSEAAQNEAAAQG
ncbi:MAG: hypothetical protein WBD20_10230 [Pirellulaceae bacterium]